MAALMGLWVYLRLPETMHPDFRQPIRPAAIAAKQFCDELKAAGADCLVTGCVSCSNSMRRGDASAPAYHYLELLFGIKIDWDGFARAQVSLDAHGGYDFRGSDEDTPLLSEG